MIRRILAATTATLAIVLAVAGTASANTPTVRVDCTGLRFDMPRGEVGTDVTVTANGDQRWTFEIARQNDPLAFRLDSPNPAAPVTWAVLVDSPWQEGETWRTFNQPACAPATTPATTTTTAGATTTTSAPPPSTSTTTTAPAAETTTTTVPPTASTTIITTPRPTTTTAPAATTSTTVPSTWRLPDTGTTSTTRPTAALGAAAIALGVLLIAAAARRRSTR